MTRSIDLSPAQRNASLDRYREDPDPEVRFRSHTLLSLDDGHTRVTVAALLFCTSRAIDRRVKRFQAEGVEGVAGHRPGRPFRLAAGRVKVVVEWVTTQTPRDFVSLRGRWCREAVAVLMLELPQVEVDREAVRSGLPRGDLVYRRPRPVVGPRDPDRQAGLDALRSLPAGLPADEAAVSRDEVDINTDPKIGSMWMVKGRQAEVETSGNNEERYPSGSIHWRTRQVFVTGGKPERGRDTALSLAHPDDLRARLRRSRKVHVICGSARCQTSDEVAVYPWDHRDRIELRLLPE